MEFLNTLITNLKFYCGPMNVLKQSFFEAFPMFGHYSCSVQVRQSRRNEVKLA